MNQSKITPAVVLILMFAMNGLQADLLPKNFWVNATFESGTNLDQIDGALLNWNRGGGDPTICQVITNNSVSASHALAVIDTNTDANGYGEWYSDVLLTGNASPGDTLDLQWFEMYNLGGPEMRLSILFFDSANNQVGGTTHYVTSGTTSPGWVSSIEDSAFTKRNGSVKVPPRAAKMRCSLVSGGSPTITGVMVIDDLSVARSAVPNLIAGNFWINPAFEIGTNLDQTVGTVSNWTRAGGDPSIAQVTTRNYSSSRHALALVDSNAGAGGYGEWDSDVPLAGHAKPGDSLNIQWYELYSVTGGSMSLSVSFLNAANATVGATTQFQTSGTNSAGWVSSVEDSAFTKRNESVVIPAEAVKIHSTFSSGPPAVTGTMLIDDLSVALAPKADLLPGNFWVNSTFELGSDLDRTNGTPAGWTRGGGDTSICLVITSNYTSAGHSLALIDTSTNDNGLGEWYSEVLLAGHASAGNSLNLQWFEMYSLSGDEMRLDVLFFDGGGNQVGETTHFATTGTNSPGWVSTIKNSAFTKRDGTVTVPNGAVKMRCSLVSGGPPAVTGVLVIDDFSVNVLPPTVQAGNMFPNPTFELGLQLDDPIFGSPSGGWQRGGSASAIDQIVSSNSVSPTHSLALVDNDSSNYGEWYTFLSLAGLVTDGDILDAQWYQIYNTDGNMRLSFAFLDAGNNVLANKDFNFSGQSSGWTGSVSASVFERQFQQLEVATGATQLRVNFASGGAASVTGIMLIDDLSIRLSKPTLTAISVDSNGVNLTWLSVPSKTYSVLFTPLMAPNAVWTALATGLASGGSLTTYLDTASHAGRQGFYRVLQE